MKISVSCSLLVKDTTISEHLPRAQPGFDRGGGAKNVFQMTKFAAHVGTMHFAEGVGGMIPRKNCNVQCLPPFDR